MIQLYRRSVNEIEIANFATVSSNETDFSETKNEKKNQINVMHHFEANAQFEIEM